MKSSEFMTRAATGRPPHQDSPQHTGAKLDSYLTFTSMKDCERQTGLPSSWISEAKRQGAPGFDPHNNRIHLLTVLRWWFTRPPTSSDPAHETTEQARRRKLQAEADLAEMDAKRRREELFTVTDADARLARIWYPVWEQLRTQPDRLAARVNPHDPDHAKQVLTEEREALFKLANELKPKDA
jgi:hypothetical protein